jgi:hypothetical protein
MLSTPIVSDTLLTESATQIQQELIDRRGIEYQIEDLKTVLSCWLQSCVETLCEDACEYCISGDRNLTSFNRDVFEKHLKEMAPLHCILI